MAVLSRRLCVPLLSASVALQSSRAFPLLSPSLGLSKYKRPSSSSTGTFHRALLLPLTTMSANSNSNSNNQNNDDDPAKTTKKPIVQYIVLRRDLDWPAGAMAAQAAHASVAAIAQALEAQHEDAKFYISPGNLPHMTKYVYGVDTLEELEQVKKTWNKQFTISSQEGDKTDTEAATPTSYWWVEQPENIPSAFATWPVERTNKVSKVVKNMKLSFF